ncbi:hypothetical protein PIIN_11368 [Serendipita indica DSM 11827]|uniref:Uncharacterized protein n=1 Tax=Serendipita indica (strain DSM 11827) TaxID=1109443 RepID=G4U1E8_SERID|nr:hypothetical protein PIIN_11368 [Serendipita indica DSM 11827]
MPSDAPFEIKQKSSQMKACVDKIEALKSRLKAAESLWNSLRDEVAGYIQMEIGNPSSRVAPPEPHSTIYPTTYYITSFGDYASRNMVTLELSFLSTNAPIIS